jgi:hypothetical protein
MPFTTQTRYGAGQSYDDDATIPSVVEDLINELETEHYEEPDDEHAQVAVESQGWALTVQVSGLMTLDDLSEIEDGKLPDALYIRANSRAEAVDMLTKMALGQLVAVRAGAWVPLDQLPPYMCDLFRQHH